MNRYHYNHYERTITIGESTSLLAEYVCQSIDPERVLSLRLPGGVLESNLGRFLAIVTLDAADHLSRYPQGDDEMLISVIEANWLIIEATVSNIVMTARADYLSQVDSGITSFIESRKEQRDERKQRGTGGKVRSLRQRSDRPRIS